MAVKSAVWPSVVGTRRCGESRRLQIRTRPGIVLRMVVEAIADIETNALEVVVHLEIDDARDRIGAVHRGSAAGQNVDALDEVSGNLVEVRA